MKQQITFTQEIITPKIAKKYLESNNSNRRVNWKAVATYADAMKKGLWELNGESLIFSKDGVLLNGQHRLYAVIKADMPVEFTVARGCSNNCFATIDTHVVRTTGQIFGIQGVPNANNVSAIVSKYMLMSAHDNASNLFSNQSICRATTYSKQEVLDEYISNSGFYQEIYSSAVKCYNALRLLKISDIGGIAAYLIKHKHYDKEKVLTFFREVSGYSTPTTCATSLLNEKLVKDKIVANKKMTSSYKTALIAKSWNMYVTNRTARGLNYNEEKEGIIRFV